MLSPFFQQLDSQCTKEQFHELLESIQNRSEEAKRKINRTGSKDEQIENLKLALDSRYVEMTEVVEFLQNCEECGRQTIFLFKPKNQEIRKKLQDGESIACDLFGDAWGPDYFPIYDKPNEGVKWVDCRLNIPGRPGDWCLKAYAHERKEDTIKNDREEIDERHFRDIREVKVVDVNTVMVVRWRDPHFLEIRIDKLKSSGFNDLRERLKMVVAMLRPAFNVHTECVAYSLEKRLLSLIDGRKLKNAKKRPYRVMAVKFLDKKEGLNELRPMMAGEDVDSDPGRTESIEAFLKNGAKPARVALEWADGDGVPKTLAPPLLTTVEGDVCSAISISSRVTPEVLDYVINKLR